MNADEYIAILDQRMRDNPRWGLSAESEEIWSMLEGTELARATEILTQRSDALERKLLRLDGHK